MFSIGVENSSDSINGVIPSLYNTWSNLKSRGAKLADVFYVRESSDDPVRTLKYSFLESSYGNVTKVISDFEGKLCDLYFTFGDEDEGISEGDREEYNKVVMEIPTNWELLAEIYNRGSYD